MDKENSTPPPQPVTDFRRDEDFTSLYANNIRLESSVWDLKLLFGELDQSAEPAYVSQHTAMSIPWMQAKLLAYFLEIYLAIHEHDNGNIRIPDSVLPPSFDSTTVAATPALVPVWEYLALIHKKYFGDRQPQAASEPAPQAGGQGFDERDQTK